MSILELTILMPCLNEALTVGTCIQRARKLLDDHGIVGEILISDNGSTDGSQKIALALGARVVDCPVRGYGAALQFGIENANGKYVLMGDSDDSYHFDEAFPMVAKLRQGYEVCMGTRLKGEIKPGAMPLLNRILGNPVLTYVGQKLFRIPTTDFHCGMRAIHTVKAKSINLVTTGMEWASEMVIKAKLNGLTIAEVPVTLHKDGRDRPPHLRRWRDGWRHLRFMLLHAPNWLFVFPGMTLFSAGAIGEAILVPKMVRVNTWFEVHMLLIMSVMLIIGVQLMFTGLMANVYAHITGILPYTEKYLKSFKGFSLEKMLVISLGVGLIGTLGLLAIAHEWYRAGFMALDYRITLRQLIPSLSLIVLCAQGIINGFMLSVLFLNTKTIDNRYETDHTVGNVSEGRQRLSYAGGVK
jgi:glycosyltransferase involved in cell wall biosynthesis